jgi:hypothetical protein
MLPRLLLRLLLGLSLGVLAGGVFGQIATGDWLYIVVWAIALGIAVITGIIVTTGMVRSLTRTEGEAAAAVPRWQWIVAGVLALAGLGAAATPAILGLTSGRLDNPITGTHQALAVSGIASAAGTSTVTELDFFPDFVLAAIVNPPAQRTVDEWTFQFGRAENTGPEVVQPLNIPLESFDMKSIDLAQVIADIPVAEKAAKMTSPTDVHVGVRRDSENDGNKPTVSVFLTDKYHDATVVFDLSGTVLHRFGTAFE